MTWMWIVLHLNTLEIFTQMVLVYHEIYNTIIFSQVLSYRIVAPSPSCRLVPKHSSITKSLIGENCWVQIELVYVFKTVLWLVVLPGLFFRHSGGWGDWARTRTCEGFWHCLGGQWELYLKKCWATRQPSLTKINTAFPVASVQRNHDLTNPYITKSPV